jgi:predicted transcriptional regulator
MAENGMRALTDKDRLFIDILQSLGVRRQEAVLIVWLNGSGLVSSKEIEQGTGLKQSDVSKILKMIRENGWLDILKTNNLARDRPKILYLLSASLNEVVRHYEQKKLNESALAMGSIQRLRNWHQPKFEDTV